MGSLKGFIFNAGKMCPERRGGGGEGSYITSELSRSILMGVGIILVWAGVKIIELVCTLHRVA